MYIFNRNTSKKGIAYTLLFMGLLSFVLKQVTYAAHPLVKLYFSSGAVLQSIEPVNIENNANKQYRVRIINIDGKGVNGAAVTWKTAINQQPVTSTEKATNAEGYSDIQLPANVNGVVVLTATYESQTKSLEELFGERYIFNRAGVGLANDFAEANGYDAVVASVEVVKADGQTPFTGGLVHWRITNDHTESARLHLNQSWSDEKGIASVKIKANKQGAATLVAEIKTPSGPLRKTVPINFRKSYNLGLQPLTVGTSYFVDKNTGAVPVSTSINNSVEGVSKIFWQLQNENGVNATLIKLNADGATGLDRVEVRSQKVGRVGVFATVYDDSAGRMRVERQGTYIDFKQNYQLSPFTVQDNKVTAEANGIDEIILKTGVMAGGSSAGAGHKVRWSFENNTANAFLPAQTSETDAQGRVEIRVKASQAGSVTVKASIQGATPQVQSQTVSFVKTYNVGLESLTADKTVVEAKTGDKATLTAAVFMEGLNPSTERRKVVWKMENNNSKAILVNTDGAVKADGKVVATLTAPIQGSVVVVATAMDASQPGKEESLRIKIYFNNPAGIESLTVSKTPANTGQDVVELLAKVVDRQGNGAEGHLVEWSLDGMSESQASFVDLPISYTSKSDSSGLARAKLSATNQGIATVIAKLVGQMDRGGLQNQRMAEVQFKRAQAALELIPSFTGSIVTSNSDNLTVTARITGITNEESVIRQKVLWSFRDRQQTDVQFVGLASDASGSYSYTNTRGQAVVRLKATRAGTVTVVAKNTELGIERPLSVKFVQPVAQSGFRLTLDKPIPLNDETVRASVKSLGADGNGTPGRTVEWKLEGVAQQVSTSGNTTDDTGSAWITYRSNGQTGLSKVTATLKNTGGTDVVQSQEIEFQRYALTTLTPAATTGGLALPLGTKSTPYTATVSSISALKRPTRFVQGKKIQVKWDNAVVQGKVLYPGGEETDANGKLTFTVENTYSGTNGITVELAGVNNNNQPDAANYIHKRVFKFGKTLNKLTVNDEASPNNLPWSRLADNSATIRVTALAVDEKNEPVPGARVNWTFTGTATRIGSLDTTGTDGKAWIDLRSATPGVVEVKVNSHEKQAVEASNRVEFQQYVVSSIDPPGDEILSHEAGSEGGLSLNVTMRSITKHPGWAVAGEINTGNFEYWWENTNDAPTVARHLLPDLPYAMLIIKSDKPRLNTLHIRATGSGAVATTFSKKIRFRPKGSPVHELKSFQLVTADENAREAKWTRLADNEETVKVTVIALNGNDKAQAGTLVKWTHEGTASVLGSTTVTDAEGKVWAEYKSLTPGLLKVKATSVIDPSVEFVRAVEFQQYAVSDFLPKEDSVEATIPAAIDLSVKLKTVSKHGYPVRYLTNKSVSHSWSKTPVTGLEVKMVADADKKLWNFNIQSTAATSDTFSVQATGVGALPLKCSKTLTFKEKEEASSDAYNQGQSDRGRSLFADNNGCAASY